MYLCILHLGKMCKSELIRHRSLATSGEATTNFKKEQKEMKKVYR